MLSLSRLTAILDRFLPPRDILRVARSTGFRRRCRLVEPRPWLLVLIFASKETLSFSALAARYGALTKRPLSKQAFRQKLIGAMPFVKEVTSTFLRLATHPPGRARLGRRRGPLPLPGIRRVLAVDSSLQCLDDALSDDFPGAGGSAGDAALRLHVTYDLTGDSVSHLEVTSSNVAERSVLRKQLDELQEKDLLLADLGYFDLDLYRSLSSQGTYFISKLPLHVVEAFAADGQRVDLWQWLASIRAGNAECGLWLGAERLLCRIVARHLNRPDHRERLKKLDAERRRKGKQPLSAEMRKRARWMVFLTNLPRTSFPLAQIFDLYRLRWQVELVYKGLKSHAGLTKLAAYRRLEVLTVMLYARLLHALFAIITHREVQLGEDDEVMYLRWCRCLTAIADTILQALIRGQTEAAASLLAATAHANCRRETRQRPTSRSRIADWLGQTQQTKPSGARRRQRAGASERAASAIP